MDPYLAALADRVLVFDGAIGTQIMACELASEAYGGEPFHGCNEALVLSRPDIVERIHLGYLKAGADVLETNTFIASRLKLAEYGLGERVGDINRAAAALARSAIDRLDSSRPRFVAGAMGPTGMLISSSDPALSKITFDELAALYAEQARHLVEGGVDLLLLETSQDLVEMQAAVTGIVREFDAGLRRVPIQAQATLDVTGCMLLGTDICAVCATLDALPIDVIGLNCSTGPAHMRDAVRYLCGQSRCYVAAIPNAGLPLEGTNGETIYPETPEQMAAELRAFVTDFGVNVVGGCCGTTAVHIAALKAAVEGLRGRTPVANSPEHAVGSQILDAGVPFSERTDEAQPIAATPKKFAHAVGPAQAIGLPHTLPRAPFYGTRVVTDTDVSELWPLFDLRSLFRFAWGGSSVKGAQWEALVRDEFEPRFKRFRAAAERNAILQPKIVYGYFPAAGDGDDIVIYDPDNVGVESARLRFARQSGGDRLCLADYLQPAGGGRDCDVIALQVVTVGHVVSERIEALQQKGDYSESYFLHGFSAQAAEALAEFAHRRIRGELGLAEERGKRYSWGYGACPNLAQHETVWRLLDAERAIDAQLTTGYQIVPEQSTAAIVIHHPKATYFNATSAREWVRS